MLEDFCANVLKVAASNFYDFFSNRKHLMMRKDNAVKISMHRHYLFIQFLHCLFTFLLLIY